MSITSIIDGVIGREGRYSDNPNDPGGPTMWGITQKTARDHGYAGLMRDLPRPLAVAIYTKDYVVAPGFDRVNMVSPAIAEELVDTGVNCGPALPGPWLQRALNVFNRQGSDYADVEVDGKIGPATIAALRAFLDKRGKDGEAVLLRMLNCMQGARYLEIAEKNPKLESFTFGWMLNRVTI